MRCSQGVQLEDFVLLDEILAPVLVSAVAVREDFLLLDEILAPVLVSVVAV